METASIWKSFSMLTLQLSKQFMRLNARIKSQKRKHIHGIFKRDKAYEKPNTFNDPTCAMDV
jgi:hypothetical protein